DQAYRFVRVVCCRLRHRSEAKGQAHGSDTCCKCLATKLRKLVIREHVVSVFELNGCRCIERLRCIDIRGDNNIINNRWGRIVSVGDIGKEASHAVNPEERKDGISKGLTNYGDRGFSLFLRKAFIKGAGYTNRSLERPVIGITNTGSAFNPCHGNMPQLLEAVKRGIMMAGGLPTDFPTISMHESFSQPTSMYLRNLMSMDTEEMLRAQPMDAVVLIGGCDKTVPAQLMGAASVGLP